MLYIENTTVCVPSFKKIEVKDLKTALKLRNELLQKYISSELKLQLVCSDWLKHNHPDVRFANLDPWTVRTTGRMVLVKRLNSDHSHLDMIIFEEGYVNNKLYNQLFIEFKFGKKSLYTTKGKLRKTSHLINQQKEINFFIKNGSYARFVTNFWEFETFMNSYLNPRKQTNGNY